MVKPLFLSLLGYITIYAVFNVFIYHGKLEHPDSYLYHNIALKLLKDSRITVYPQYSNILLILYKIFGTNILWPRLLNLIAHLLTTVFAYLTVLRLTKCKRASFWAALFTGLNPYTLYLSTQVLRDPLIILGIAITIYFAIKKSSLIFIGLIVSSYLRPQLNYVLAGLSAIIILPTKKPWPIYCIILTSFLIILVPPFISNTNIDTEKQKAIAYNESGSQGNIYGSHIKFFEPRNHLDIVDLLLYPQIWKANTKFEYTFALYSLSIFVIFSTSLLGHIYQPQKSSFPLIIFALGLGLPIAYLITAQGHFVRIREMAYYPLLLLCGIGFANLLSNPYYAIKRCFDLIFSIFLIIILSVPFFTICLVLKAIPPHIIFFKQVRIGHGEKPFTIFKFNTMIPNFENRPATNNDERIPTKFHKLLRTTALDEIPELLAVFQGKMSIVGPRALADWEYNTLKKEISNFSVRQIVKPGFIGPAQLYTSRYDNEEKLKYDVLYIQNQSFLYDLKLIALGLFANLTQRWI
jgi:lipopolysaccharide/colanic/teichoic acid biosynthesis glycosyltransferase